MPPARVGGCFRLRPEWGCQRTGHQTRSCGRGCATRFAGGCVEDRHAMLGVRAHFVDAARARSGHRMDGRCGLRGRARRTRKIGERREERALLSKNGRGRITGGAPPFVRVTSGHPLWRQRSCRANLLMSSRRVKSASSRPGRIQTEPARASPFLPLHPRTRPSHSSRFRSPSCPAFRPARNDPAHDRRTVQPD